MSVISQNLQEVKQSLRVLTKIPTENKVQAAVGLVGFIASLVLAMFALDLVDDISDAIGISEGLMGVAILVIILALVYFSIKRFVNALNNGRMAVEKGNRGNMF